MTADSRVRVWDVDSGKNMLINFAGIGNKSRKNVTFAVSRVRPAVTSVWTVARPLSSAEDVLSPRLLALHHQMRAGEHDLHVAAYCNLYSSYGG